MQTLKVLLNQVIKAGDVSAIWLILDFLEEQNDIRSQYRLRCLYTAIGILLTNCRGITDEINRESKTDRLFEIQNMGRNFNRRSRTWDSFERRLQEIFWDELNDRQTVISLIETNIPKIIRCKDV